MKISGVYRIESKLKPERCYIGSAVNITHRWQLHLQSLQRNKHHSQKLQRHFNKYSEFDLSFSVLLGCEKEDLLKTEQYFIDSYNPYFNNCKIAGSVLGCHWKLSKEICERQSIRRMGHAISKETRNKIGIANKNKIHSKEQNENHNKKIKGYVPTESSRISRSKKMKGMPKTEEHSRHIKESWVLRKQKKLENA